MTLMEKLAEAGYPREEMFNHASDLYIYATSQTKRVVEEWFSESGLDKSLFCSIFKNNITGSPMFDIAFQYDDYWKELSELAQKENRRIVE